MQGYHTFNTQIIENSPTSGPIVLCIYFFLKYMFHKVIFWLWLSWFFFTNFCYPSRTIVPAPMLTLDVYNTVAVACRHIVTIINSASRHHGNDASQHEPQWLHPSLNISSQHYIVYQCRWTASVPGDVQCTSWHHSHAAWTAALHGKHVRTKTESSKEISHSSRFTTCC